MREGPLAGRVVVVTGANSGIGFGIALGVARAGANVALWGRRREANVAAAREITGQTGATCRSYEVDIAVEEEVSAAMAGTVDDAGRLDAFFANAGQAVSPVKFTDMTLDQWRSVTRVNLDGTFLCLQAAARRMIEQGTGGALVATSSLSDTQGAPRMQSYAASKAGVSAVVRGLAVELARHRIRANILAPGWIATPLTAATREAQSINDSITARIPIRRWGSPAELEAIAVYLADREPLLHTGDRIVVDGGYSLT